MRFNIHLRAGVKERLGSLVQEMAQWEERPLIDDDEAKRIREAIQPFQHTIKHADLRIAGVDGSGDFPALSYGDSFVYISVAQATCYGAHRLSGLKELEPVATPIIEFSWLPENENRLREKLDAVFESMVSMSVEEVIESSDYRILKSKQSGKAISIGEHADNLVRPHASDTGNLAIQLRTTAELGAALQVIQSDLNPHYLLFDSTFSLPFVKRARNSLFFEHVKRLCCVEARKRSIGFFALSKSHGMPAMERIEMLAAEKQGLATGRRAEHWYFRIPEKKRDGWVMDVVEGRQLPPVGAITYLVRFHRTTPVMRLDMDVEYWKEHVQGNSEEETRENEYRIFEDLDYASHDQRCYGYPYPIKAGHDRASMTEAERVALRKMVIDAAAQVGMKRSLFRSASKATGHG